ncbi:MAG: hypothetical protein LBF26_01550 [Puniceicoccales bacterium]|jgi:hypothetical protein|nr:hypothetical protein [Puniceicoccales bacterium]
MCNATTWKVDIGEDIIMKEVGSATSGAVTILKILRGISSVMYHLAIFLKWVSVIGTTFAGGLTGLSILGAALPVNAAIHLFLCHWWTYGLACVFSTALVPILDFLRHRADRSILMRELPKDLPIDIYRTFKKVNNMRDKLATIIPQGLNLGGTRKFSLEIATDAKPPLMNNVEYPPKVHLIEIFQVNKVIGFVANGKDNKTYYYIKCEDFAENFWKKDSWKQFSTSAELSVATGVSTP